jgi:hypothetical protein
MQLINMRRNKMKIIYLLRHIGVDSPFKEFSILKIDVDKIKGHEEQIKRDVTKYWYFEYGTKTQYEIFLNKELTKIEDELYNTELYRKIEMELESNEIYRKIKGE